MEDRAVRMQASRLVSAVLLGLVLSAAPACASSGGRLYVRTAPPLHVVEGRGVAPGRGYVWISGYHHWNGRAYSWVPGRWSAPPRPRAVWVPGRWVHDRRGWYFVDGRWRH
jgi:hypothetical protein